MTQFADITINLSVVSAWIVGSVISLAGAIKGYSVVHRKMVRPVMGHVKGLHQLVQLAPSLQIFLDEDLPKIKSAAKQVQPNAGQSLADKVVKIEYIVSSMQEQLTEAAAMGRFTLENSKTAAFICDEHGSNEFVNESYCELLKADSSALMGFGWKSYIWHGDKEYEHIWKEAFAEGRSFRCQLRFVGKNDEPVHVGVQCSCIKKEGRKKYLGMMQQVTSKNSDLIAGSEVKASLSTETSKIKL